MGEKKLSLETLKSENYTYESHLNAADKKQISKMFRYMKSFPLDEYELELMRKDLNGMATEAEQRGQTLDDVVEGDCYEFCNNLIRNGCGIDIPKGRKLLRISGTLLMILGILNLIVLGLVIISLPLAAVSALDEGLPIFAFFPEGRWENPVIQVLYSVFQIFVMVFWLYAGKVARKCSGDIKYTKKCIHLGLALCAVSFLDVVGNMIGSYTVQDLIWNAESFFSLLLTLAINLFLPVIYFVGAKKNLK